MSFLLVRAHGYCLNFSTVSSLIALDQDLVDAICCHVWLLKFEEVEINKSLAER